MAPYRPTSWATIDRPTSSDPNRPQRRKSLATFSVHRWEALAGKGRKCYQKANHPARSVGEAWGCVMRENGKWGKRERRRQLPFPLFPISHFPLTHMTTFGQPATRSALPLPTTSYSSPGSIIFGRSTCLGKLDPLGRADQADLAGVDRLEAELQGGRVGLEAEVEAAPGRRTSGRRRSSSASWPFSCHCGQRQAAGELGRLAGRRPSSSSIRSVKLPFDQLPPSSGHAVGVDDVPLDGERAVLLLPRCGGSGP